MQRQRPEDKATTAPGGFLIIPGLMKVQPFEFTRTFGASGTEESLFQTPTELKKVHIVHNLRGSCLKSKKFQGWHFSKCNCRD